MAGSRGSKKKQNNQDDSSTDVDTPPRDAAVEAVKAYNRLESANERRQRILNLFNSMDTDRSGYLEIKEIEDYAASSANGLAGAAAFASDLMAADANGDGRVDFNEFHRFVQAKETSLYETFLEYDDDGSGQLSAEEICAVLGAHGIKPKTSEVERFLSKISTDGDDQISWQEFRDAFTLNANAVNMVEAFKSVKAAIPVSPGFNILMLPEDAQKSEELQGKIVAASVISSAAARILCAPLDRIKVFFQLMPNQSLSFFQSLRHGLTKIAADNGLLSGLFRGTRLNLLKLIPETSVRVLALGGSRVMVARFERADDGISISRPGLLFSNAFAAAAAVLVSHPFETVRTQQMAGLEQDAPTKRTKPAEKPPSNPTSKSISKMPLKKPSFSKAITSKIMKNSNSLFHTTTVAWARVKSRIRRSGAGERTSHLYKTSGFRGFFSGLTPSLLSIVPYTAISESVYEWCEDEVLERDTPYKPPQIGVVLGMGLLGATIAEFATYPLSTLRTKMMSQGTPSNPDTYRNTWDCAKQTVAKSGVRGLFGGIGAAIMKGVPSVTVAYWTFEIAKRRLGANWNSELGIWQDAPVEE